jgi:catechol 2,3-dioxygenase-like lactoylglutathione lyase family enzyme
MLAPPKFHHLHLNSVDPDHAIEFYTRQFASTAKTSWGGFAALQSPNDVLVLFTKVDSSPATKPQSAIWHFGWHVTDARQCLKTYKSRPEVELLPLYTTDGGGSVLISSDTWPSVGGVLGLTRAQIAEAKAKGVQPKGGGGFAYMRGPDNALVEYAGDHPAERFNHVHLYQEDPIAAFEWYQTHLCAPVRPGYEPIAVITPDGKPGRGPDRTWPALDREGMLRSPRAGVEFADVSMMWYANQGDEPLVPSRGQLQDHIALSVADLDAWADKLTRERVKFLEPIYRLGKTRALMIEGPSREAIELVEVK